MVEVEEDRGEAWGGDRSYNWIPAWLCVVCALHSRDWAEGHAATSAPPESSRWTNRSTGPQKVQQRHDMIKLYNYITQDIVNCCV